jgi:hypothetical protein
MKLQIRLETPDSSYAAVTIHFEFLMTIQMEIRTNFGRRVLTGS